MKKIIIFLLFALVQSTYSQWQECNNGLYGGDVRTIAVKGNYIVASTNGKGAVYLTSNNGTSWKKINSGLNNNIVTCLTFQDSNLFAGTQSDGIYLTKDFGDNWSKVSIGLSNLNVSCFAVSGSNIFAGTVGRGMFLSTNSGASWDSVNTGLTNKTIYCITINGSYIYTGTYGSGTMGGGIFVSTNNGTSWTLINTGLNFQSAVNNIVVNDTAILVSTTINGVFLSTNNGANWKFLTSIPSGYGINTMVINNGKILVGTLVKGIELSSDNGTSWTQINDGMPDLAINCLSVSNQNIYAGTPGSGIYRTQTADSVPLWTKIENTGFTEALVNCLAIGDSDIYAGTADGIFHSTNNGANWSQTIQGLTSPNIVGMILVDSNIIAGAASSSSSTGGGIFLSKDKGESWIHTFNEYGLGVNCFDVDSSGIYAGTPGSEGVILSTDKGESWAAINTNSDIHNQDVNSLVINGNNIFAGTGYNPLGAMSGVFLSSDKGENWLYASDGLPTQYLSVYALLFNGSNLFAGVNGLYISGDNGTNWTQVITKTKLDSGAGIKALEGYGRNIFVGTSNYGVFLSTDGGSVWSQINGGLNSISIKTIKIKEPYVYAGINGGGVYRAKLTDFGITNVKENTYGENIFNIFPNPASDFIEILGINPQVNLWVDGQINICIYNVLGEKILDCNSNWLFEENNTRKTISSYKIKSQTGVSDLPDNLTPSFSVTEREYRIDVSGLATGIYFVRVGNFVGRFVKM